MEKLNHSAKDISEAVGFDVNELTKTAVLILNSLSNEYKGIFSREVEILENTFNIRELAVLTIGYARELTDKSRVTKTVLKKEDLPEELVKIIESKMSIGDSADLKEILDESEIINLLSSIERKENAKKGSEKKLSTSFSLPGEGGEA